MRSRNHRKGDNKAMADENKKSKYRGYTEAQNKATQKYVKEKLEEIKIRVVKDSEKNREYYKEAAAKRGYSSLNQFALTAMDEKIEREPVEEE